MDYTDMRSVLNPPKNLRVRSAKSYPFPLWRRYFCFAAIATLCNIGSQSIMMMISPGHVMLILAIACGTGVGLVTKYFLDKHWIFFDQTNSLEANAKRFIVYATTGVVTTSIFWGSEYGFELLTDSAGWRYFGAAIGLAIGYCTKYQLDRHFVFCDAELISVTDA